MKQIMAKYANSALMVVGKLLVTTNSIFNHRPETPTELLKK